MARSQLRSRLFPAALALALFLLILGSKWWVLDRFGSDLPNWDQWDAEGKGLLIPWFEGGRFVHHLFEPHNEHRVVMTKLTNLALTLWAGQWDARLECAFNAALHAAIGAALWLAGRRWIGAPFSGAPPALLQPLWFLLVAALFGLPVAWPNLLAGFHSQQYWLLGLSLAALLVLPFARPWSAGWWVAVAATACTLLTMASGALAACVVLALVAWRCWRGDDAWRTAWPTLAAAGTIAAVGLATITVHEGHTHLKAKSLHDFAYSLLHSLQWPIQVGNAWWAALLLWSPFAIVFWRAVRERAVVARLVQPIALLGCWVVLQLLATAYARGAGGDWPAPRYMDTLAVGMVANGLALGWLLTGAVARPWSIARAILGVAWFATLCVGLWQLLPHHFRHDFPDAARFFRKAEASVKSFLAAGDRQDLLHDDIPYPRTDQLVVYLNHQHLRALMPASVRAPLALREAPPEITPDAPAVTDGRAFLANLAPLRSLSANPPRRGFSPGTTALASHPTWGSFGPRGPAATGEWRSAPITATLGGWLKFETAGDLGLPPDLPAIASATTGASAKAGQPGVSLELRDATTDALRATVRPSRVPGDAWRAAYVRTPREPFVVVARDSSAERWFAFSAPVEMSGPSFLAWVAVKNGRLLTFVAAAACLLLGGVAFYQRVLFPTVPRRAQP